MSEVVIRNEAKELAEVLMLLKEGDGVNNSLSLPIDTIDGVYVECKIDLYSKRVLFKVDLPMFDEEGNDYIRLYSYNQYNQNEITKDDLESFCSDIFKRLPLLKLNSEGMLCITRCNGKTVRDKVDKIFHDLNCDNITKSCSEECCVCYNITRTTTPCKHHLCYRCWSKMNNDNNNDDNDEYIKCPICREDLPL
jgi:hypothetical protein